MSEKRQAWALSWKCIAVILKDNGTGVSFKEFSIEIISVNMTIVSGPASLPG